MTGEYKTYEELLSQFDTGWLADFKAIYIGEVKFKRAAGWDKIAVIIPDVSHELSIIMVESSPPGTLFEYNNILFFRESMIEYLRVKIEHYKFLNKML